MTTTVLSIGRPMRGKVGETKRVCHFFDLGDHYPGRAVARCGAVFYSADLDWLDVVSGMPCERCLVCPEPASHRELES